MANKIAFATYERFPNLTDDDRLAVDVLSKHGVEVEAALWTDKAVHWSTYSAVIIRSCWDYHLKPDEFRSWLDKLGRESVVLWNPDPILRWNMDKRYLSDLQEQGIPVLDSVWLPDGAKANLGDLMQQKGWDQVVVKPLISAAAKDTEIIPFGKADEHQHDFETLLNKGGVIVQDFAEEICTKGEWSLIFFNKEYSHAVIKRPQDGDFRVQFDFGGKVFPSEAPPNLIRQSQKVIDTIEEDLLYARVDGLERNGIFNLMELELIEPHLFLELDSHAPDRFAAAILKNILVKERKL